MQGFTINKKYTFFAHHMAQGIGIELPEISLDEQYHLQGLESEMHYGGQRWMRLASLYPESIDSVGFYRDEVWKAVVHL